MKRITITILVRVRRGSALRMMLQWSRVFVTAQRPNNLAQICKINQIHNLNEHDILLMLCLAHLLLRE